VTVLLSWSYRRCADRNQAARKGGTMAFHITRRLAVGAVAGALAIGAIQSAQA